MTSWTWLSNLVLGLVEYGLHLLQLIGLRFRKQQMSPRQGLQPHGKGLWGWWLMGALEASPVSCQHLFREGWSRASADSAHLFPRTSRNGRNYLRRSCERSIRVAGWTQHKPSKQQFLAKSFLFKERNGSRWWKLPFHWSKLPLLHCIKKKYSWFSYGITISKPRQP